jgi:hypothetical protein
MQQFIYRLTCVLQVLFFWCDGISWDTADPIFEKFPTNNNIFKYDICDCVVKSLINPHRITHEYNPWSAWIFATVMTGKADRNMGSIKNDNLMFQFFQAGYFCFSFYYFTYSPIGMKVDLGAEPTRAYVFNQLDLNFQNENSSITPHFVFILTLI